MSEWRGVLKHGHRYWTGKRGKFTAWTSWRDEAQVFTSQRDVEQARLRLSNEAIRMSARIVRLRPAGEARREAYDAQVKARELAIAKANEVRDQERARIADWLAEWLKLNEILVASEEFKRREPQAQRFSQGMVCVLSQAVPRIRAGQFAKVWDYR